MKTCRISCENYLKVTLGLMDSESADYNCNGILLPVNENDTKGELIMKHSDWTQTDSHKAKQIWEEYQKQHNLSDRIGQTVGIDPKSKRIWFGASIQDIVLQRNSEGLDSPLFFERVGSETYFRKGGHR